MYQEYATRPMDSPRVKQTALAAEFPRPEERPLGDGKSGFLRVHGRWPRDWDLYRVVAVRGSESTKVTVAPVIHSARRSRKHVRGLNPGSIPDVLNEGKSAQFAQEAVCQRRTERQRWAVAGEPFRIAPSPIGRFRGPPGFLRLSPP